jgi:hypothetical protein
MIDHFRKSPQGKTIRVDPQTLSKLNPHKSKQETMTAFLNRVLLNLAEGKRNDDIFS